MGKAIKHAGMKGYAARSAKPHGVLNARDYIIPTGWKRRKNISGAIDKIVYGVGKR